MAETRWKDIYNFLKSKGYDVYSIGQHKGFCESPYIVVKETNTIQVQNFPTDAVYYKLLCYVPETNYSHLAEFVNQVEKDMTKMLPMIRCAHTRDEPYHDTDVKAFSQGTLYVNYRKQL